MEWIEGAEKISEQNITLDQAVALVAGLEKIHNAGILHFDTYPRNMLVVPGSRRAVWIDFSCSQAGEEYHHDSELYTGGIIPVSYVSTNSCPFADIPAL